MKVEVEHSIIQDMSVIKFLSLKDYHRALDFLDTNGLSWTPLKYSSRLDTASIRVSEGVLNIITNKFGIGKSCQH
ncbi:hypothetical protein pEaSNUABM50_00073 [Erwinia phage pEa_SNUABM_50]|uniref:Uncharacterized protein n=4 Tax=Eneladusvirus BF TaxID=2560751 RepID=A0A7L8ZMW3_9CAUD|nr:hypothetical protein FDH34_gp075 [Serratia phage BF]QOI71013.1 hypothetical protein pEaSNUABM12_00075 [Erwinia phage pEa_SNUABM_12]QOI71558.1 hypothetical protein pEaSNUABM47_00074 [Erwinia phage pEa_SNUABM_47]QOI72097.1 hypothetical protein pEaSNUABM50_00073 [Erwinia phage pEa_SNUABM_50]QXO11222.1 hypothetical protein pEaSNUABM19_00076 [Erwinia phage pEa_SNUABM_19]QXO11770.1 hypothetical protein pEaSNUABM44_00074 [Erwinia phage pEa_SNUABM_44]QXO12321.1 hypothetical protein pEaSNUABM49_000